MEQLELHELCDLFPPMEEESFLKLEQDILENGVIDPIMMYEGKILDGRHRYAISKAYQIEVEFKEYDGNDALKFVISRNFHRRHLTQGQKAAIIASLQNWEIANQKDNKKLSKKSGEIITPVSSKDRAESSGVSLKTQKKADLVAKENPELIKKIRDGEIPLDKGYKEIKTTKPKPEPPTHEPEPEFEIDLVKEYEEAIDEIEVLNGLVESLQKEDSSEEITSLHAQIKMLHTQIKSMSARVNQLLTSLNEMTKQATYQGKILRKLRDYFGVEKSSDIIRTVKSHDDEIREIFNHFGIDNLPIPELLQKISG